MGAAVLVAWALNAASAHDASDLPAGPIRDRHELMEGIGKNAKIINEALKKGDVSPVADAAEGHSAEREGRDPQPGVAQQCVAHSLPLSLTRKVVSWLLTPLRCCRRRCASWRR